MNAPLNLEVLLASITTDIDTLYLLDQEAKALADKVKTMKADLANKYGEGKFIGEHHSVEIKLVAVAGTVDYQRVCEKYNITEAELDSFRKEGRVDIRVSPKK